MRTTRVARPVTRSGEATRDEISAAHDFFESLAPENDAEVQISTMSLDFGGVAAVGALTGKITSDRRRTITITNSTNAKVCVVWRAPAITAAGSQEDQMNLQSGQPDFVITPLNADIAAGRSFDFRVEFKPTRQNTYSFCELEAVVFFKSQRSFRLVNVALLAPPWSFAVTTMGHSFTGEQFAPQLSFKPGSHKRLFPVDSAAARCLRLAAKRAEWR